MKRVMAVLAMLLTAAAAEARTLIITPQTISGNGIVSHTMPRTQVEGELARRNARYLSVTGLVADTSVIRTGYMRDSLSHTGVQFDLIVFAGYYRGGWANAAYDPVYIMRVANWASVPIIFIGVEGRPNANKWATANNDSLTGVNTNGPSALYTAAQGRLYSTKTLRPWYTGSSDGFVRGTAPTASTFFRTIVGYGASTCQDNTPCANANAMAGTMSANPDTIALWVRGVNTGAGYSFSPAAKNRSWLIFCNQSGSSLDTRMITASLTLADSLTGGQVFDDSTAVKQKEGLVLGTAFSTGRYSTGDGSPSGIFCAADSCDSANVSASFDSVISRGKRVTIPMQPDSAAALAWQAPYYRKLGALAHYTYEDRSGILTYAGTNASKYRTMDVFGESRTRWFVPRDSTRLPCNCPDADSSRFCLLSAALTRTDSVARALGGALDRTITAPNGRWGCQNMLSRSPVSGKTPDSLYWCDYQAGARGYLTNPLINAMSSFSTWSAPQVVQGYAAVWDSAGPKVNARVMATMPIIPARRYEEQGGLLLRPVHDNVGEANFGLATGAWWPSRRPFHVSPHDFYARTYVQQWPISGFGGAGQGTTARRFAWYEMARSIDTADMVNLLGLPGRTYIEFDWLENIAKTPGGLR